MNHEKTNFENVAMDFDFFGGNFEPFLGDFGVGYGVDYIHREGRMG